MEQQLLDRSEIQRKETSSNGTGKSLSRYRRDSRCRDNVVHGKDVEDIDASGASSVSMPHCLRLVGSWRPTSQMA